MSTPQLETLIDETITVSKDPNFLKIFVAILLIIIAGYIIYKSMNDE